jgi:rhodanese-related sulfurtransferase
VILAGALLLFIAAKWWQRRRFYRLLRMARISPADLDRLIEERRDPIILDVRTKGARTRDPQRIPGARLLEFSEIPEKLAGLPLDREIVLYCT